MDVDILFVNEQIGVQERLAAKYASQPHRSGLHLGTAERFRSLLSRIESLLSENAEGSPVREKINISLTDLQDIPPELLEELSVSETDIQEMVIEDIIIKNSGVISLDKLIVKFFHRQKEVLRRNTLTSRLYRMAEKGMIFNVPGKRGYYSSFEMNETEVRKYFGKPEDLPEEDEKKVEVTEPQQEQNSGGVMVRRRRRVHPLNPVTL